jgi:hypothetical protein
MESLDRCQRVAPLTLLRHRSECPAGKPRREPECAWALEDRKRSDNEAIGEDLQLSGQVGIVAKWR